MREEKKIKRRGTSDRAGEGEDNSDRERLEGQQEHQRSGRGWRWLKRNKLFLIISTGQF